MALKAAKAWMGKYWQLIRQNYANVIAIRVGDVTIEHALFFRCIQTGFSI